MKRQASKFAMTMINMVTGLISIESCRICKKQFQPRHLLDPFPLAICKSCWKDVYCKNGVMETLVQDQVILNVASGAPYSGKVKDLIHQLKYSKDRLLANDLSALLLSAWNLLELHQHNIKDPLFVPIPLSKQRLKERGFNQAEELARHLSVHIGGKLASSALVRTKVTMPQYGLTRDERKENLTGAFFGQAMVRNKTVVIVDDIYTSGSTLAAAAGALIEAGAKSICAITVARA